ncbi:MAG: hypothetical protein J6L83_07270 [Clostridia bacterium]|nr:hypothetical protein [Clostridia bacterium]
MTERALKIPGYAVLYGIAVFISNFFCSMACLSFKTIAFVPIAEKIPYALLITLVLLADIIFKLVLPLVCVYFVMRYTVPRLYAFMDGQGQIKCFLLHVLPMEIVRYIVCLLSLGHLKQTGYFALLPSFIFENTYIRWSGRHNEIRNYLDYIPEDFLAYTLCYVVYAVVYLTFAILIYRKFWKVGREESEELIVYDKKQRLY